MKKIRILYGQAETALARKSIQMLSEICLEFTGTYPTILDCREATKTEGFTDICIGTADDNPTLRTLGLSATHPEGYTICVKDGTVYILGADERGLLYGCVDFYCKYLTPLEYPQKGGKYHQNPLSADLPDFELSSHPAVSRRGIWTWGHVIFDYKRFFDNMLRLKLNEVTIWNDVAPLNAKEIMNYAKDLGIKVVWGYAWGWDTNCKEIPLDKLCGVSEQIFETFEREYAPLGADAIYFQSLTETAQTEKDGVLIASAVTEFVNKTASLFYEKYPDIEIQFGLHATSVKDHLDAIKLTDPRIRIVWEDVGCFPFWYYPKQISGFDKTMALLDSISTLRGENEKFGAVLKGITQLDWSEFEHTFAPMYVGVSDKRTLEENAKRKRKIWHHMQAYWLINADKVLETVRLMTKNTGGDLYICALVEDGMFEHDLMYIVALFAEMLWDADADIKKLMSEVALRGNVEFA